jgi:hypothetical protein
MSDETQVIDPFVIRLLDAQRFELARMRPDEAANRVAGLTLSDPQFSPRYIVTTESSTSIFATSSTARASTNRTTTIERDAADQAAESFAQGFTDGFNEAILRAAQRVCDEGFTESVSVAPRSGRRGRLYFRPPRPDFGHLIFRVGESGEFQARPVGN